MRSLAVVAFAALLLSGCSGSKEAAASDAVPAEGAGVDANAVAAAGNSSLSPMRFAGGDLEAEIPISLSFANTDQCILGFTACPTQTIDLTPIVPVDRPVELSVVVEVNSNVVAGVTGDDAVSFVQYSQDRSQGRIAIDVLLVRGAEGAVQLYVASIFPSADSVQAGTLVTGTAHSIARADVVPAYIPVAVELGPGDLINVTGDGLEEVVVYPPTGAAVRLLQEPYELRLPGDAPEGTYFLFAVADEAVRVAGPNRTLVAHRLVHVLGSPTDIPMGQETTWQMEVPGFPVVMGIILESKDTVPDCCGIASYLGPHQVRLTSPENVDVLVEKTDCLPLMGCPLNPIGSSWSESFTDFLEEHLTKGTYKATVTFDQSNNVQGSIWAMYIV